MTPKRKKYLASISKEEMIIRNSISFYTKKIKIFKRLMNVDKEDINFIRESRIEIAKRKHLIKNLKKQLSAPRKFLSSLKCWSFCPICNNDVTHEKYCPSCGQKLR